MKLSATTVGKEAGVFGAIISQKIQFINKNKKSSLILNHYKSINSQTGRRLTLDSVAQSWRCFQAQSGLRYIFIDFACTHDDARGCDTSTRSSTRDWTNIYDESGQPLIKNSGEISDAEQAALKFRGLWQEFIQASKSSTENKLIYEYKYKNK